MTAHRPSSPPDHPARPARRFVAFPALLAAVAGVARAVIVGRDRGEIIPPPSADELQRDVALRLQQPDGSEGYSPERGSS